MSVNLNSQQNNTKIGVRVYLGSDHAGFEMKRELISFLKENGFDLYDCGPKEYVHDDDYPDYVSIVARCITDEPGAMGIVLGWSGQGEAVAANRFSGIRAVVFNGQYAPADGRELPDEIKISREHNDANILSLGARFLNFDESRSAVTEWLATSFSNDERHMRRLNKIDQIK